MIFQNEDDLNEFIKSKLTNKESTCLIKGSGIDIKKFSNSNKKQLGHFHSPVRLLFPSRKKIISYIFKIYTWGAQGQMTHFNLIVNSLPRDLLEFVFFLAVGFTAGSIGII